MVSVPGGECPVCAERMVDGGAYCWTNGCTCQTGDWCVIIQGFAEGGVPGGPAPGLALDADLARDIAKVDPYGGAVVAQLAQSPHLWFGHSQISLPGVVLEAGDAHRRLFSLAGGGTLTSVRH